MTNIQPFDGSAVERMEEGGERVPLLRRVLLLLLEGEGVEEEVGGERHYQVLLRAQAERPCELVFASVEMQLISVQAMKIWSSMSCGSLIPERF